MELREPKRKWRVRASVQQPFPILNRDVTAIPTNRDLWQVYTGKYSGDFVIVDTPDEMSALHNMENLASHCVLFHPSRKITFPSVKVSKNKYCYLRKWIEEIEAMCFTTDGAVVLCKLCNTEGFFGKGSLSRGSPQFGKERQGVPPFIHHRQWERRRKWAEQQEARIKEYNKKQNECSQEKSSRHNSLEDQVMEETPGRTTDNQTSEPEINSSTASNQAEESSITCDKNSDDKKDDRVKGKNTENNCEAKSGTNKQINENGANKTSINNCNNRDEPNENKDEEIITLDSAEEDNESGVNSEAAVIKCNENPVKNDGTKKDSETSGELKRKSNRTELQCNSKAAKLSISDNLSNEASCEKLSTQYPVESKERMLLVLPDSDSDDEGYLTNISPKLEKEPFPICETLHLTLEEAFFLSFGLGCLQVIDLFGNCLTLDGMWQLFCKSQKDFIQKYVAYHYFRSKGWVVKPGIKFGGDLLLYKQGPPFYHASYIVLVEVIDKHTWTRVPGDRLKLSWTRLMGFNRLAEAAAKEILLCQVVWPTDIRPESLHTPAVISKFQVHEVLMRRWVSSQEREENDIQ